jgi:NADH dehydrogenase
VRRIIGKRDIAFHQTEIEEIDLQNKRVITQKGAFEYDTLILALGAITNYFGNESFEKYGFPFKTMADGLKLRNHVIDLLERADRSTDLQERRRLLTFIQAGAGACGLEVMTELREFLHKVCGKAYPTIDFQRDVRLILAEGLPRVLSGMPEACALAACEKMGRREIKIRLNTFVTNAGPGWVEIDGKERVDCETLIWVAGIKTNPLVAGLPVEHDKMGRIKVDEFNAVPDCPGVYAIGDNAHFVEDGEPLSSTAQVAVQQGPALARNLVAQAEERPMKPFKFHYRGDLVAIGTLDAVSSPYGHTVNGAIGWLLFKWVYFSKMPTMQNRFRLLSDWVLHALQGPTVARLEYDGTMMAPEAAPQPVAAQRQAVTE